MNLFTTIENGIHKLTFQLHPHNPDTGHIPATEFGPGDHEIALKLTHDEATNPTEDSIDTLAHGIWDKIGGDFEVAYAFAEKSLLGYAARFRPVVDTVVEDLDAAGRVAEHLDPALTPAVAAALGVADEFEKLVDGAAAQPATAETVATTPAVAGDEAVSQTEATPDADVASLPGVVSTEPHDA